MNFFKTGSFFVLFFSFISLPLLAGESQERFPFLAEVSSQALNIRAGQNMNFEKLCRLSRGSEVVVVGKSYDWYKISLPAAAKSYVSQDYIQLMNDNRDPSTGPALSAAEVFRTGVVTANRVNIRGGAGSNFTALGQLKKGDRIKVLEKSDGWYRIQPVEGTYGWVSKQFLAFKSYEIPPLEILQTISTENSTLAATAASQEHREVQPQKESLSRTPKILIVSGRLKTIPDGQQSPGARLPIEEKIGGQDIRYQLVSSEATIYDLEGSPEILGEFFSCQVQVEGNLKEYPLNSSGHPVIVVSRINLVL